MSSSAGSARAMVADARLARRIRLAMAYRMELGLSLDRAGEWERSVERPVGVAKFEGSATIARGGGQAVRRRGEHSRSAGRVARRHHKAAPFALDRKRKWRNRRHAQRDPRRVLV